MLLDPNSTQKKLATSMTYSFLAPLFAKIPGGFSVVPILAQASVDGAVDRFLSFLAKIFLILGVLIIAYGGYLIHQGRLSEGLLAILGGFILALAIPLMKLLMQMAGV
jgi:hypothetical protein